LKGAATMRAEKQPDDPFEKIKEAGHEGHHPFDQRVEQAVAIPDQGAEQQQVDS